jgi:hypothetical protein
MSLPVWVTVFVSGIVGGWIGERVSVLLVLPALLGGNSAETLASNVTAYLIVGGAIQAAITGGVLLVLLPPLSGIRVGFGTCFVATLAGNALTVVGSLLLLRATLHSNLAAGGGVALVPALGLMSIVLAVAGIAVTTVMITSGQGGGSSRLDGYGGSAYLDEYRKGDS